MRDRIEARGPLLVLIGAAALLGASLLTWYAIDLSGIPGGAGGAAAYARRAGFATTADAWRPWGFFSDAVLFCVIAGGIGLGALGLAFGTGGRRLLMPGAALGLGVAGVLLVTVHVIEQPTPRDVVEVRPAAWLGLAAAVVLLVGAAMWWDRAVRSAASSGESGSR